MMIDRRHFAGLLAGLAVAPVAAVAAAGHKLPQPDPGSWDPPALPLVEGMSPGPNGAVYYRRHGTRGRTPLIVLHGGPVAGHRYMRPYAALATDRQVVLYDQSGGGKSARPADLARYTLDIYVAELEALRAHLGFDRVVLLGHSWGGLLAPAYAAKYPHRVAGLVLAGTAPTWRDFTAASVVWLRALGPAAVATAAAGSRDGRYGALLDLYYAQHLCRLDPPPAWFVAEGEALAANRVYRYLNGPSEFEFTGAFAALDVRAALRGIAVPTLVTCGEFDEGAPWIGRKIAALVPHAHFVEFDGLSHMSHIEDPVRVIATTRAFVDAIG